MYEFHGLSRHRGSPYLTEMLNTVKRCRGRWDFCISIELKLQQGCIVVHGSLPELHTVSIRHSSSRQNPPGRSTCRTRSSRWHAANGQVTDRLQIWTFDWSNIKKENIWAHISIDTREELESQKWLHKASYIKTNAYSLSKAFKQQSKSVQNMYGSCESQDSNVTCPAYSFTGQKMLRK